MDPTGLIDLSGLVEGLAGDLLGTVIAVMLTAVIIVPVMQALKLNPVLGYLAAGALLGPHALELIQTSYETTQLAEVGVVFLLFTIGLELSVDKIKSMRRLILGVGLSQVVACALAIGSVCWMLGLSTGASITIGLALALSSTAVVMKVLGDTGQLAGRMGRVAFAVLLLQDIMVAPILTVVPLLADSGGNALATLGLALVKAAVAVTIILAAGRFLMTPIFHWVARSGNREVFVALTLLVALGTGFATYKAGLSMPLGAFLAGLLLAGSAFRHQVEADIEPYRGILLGFFFMTVGMQVNPGILINEAPVILAIVVGLIVLKGVINYAVMRAWGVEGPVALSAGLLLSEGGEFAFVVFALALVHGVMPEGVAQTLIAAVAITMALTPVLANAGRRLGHRWERRLSQQAHSGDGEDPLTEAADDLSDHVLICGYGRVGQAVGEMLTHEEVPFIALDMDPARIARARAHDKPVFYGNVLQEKVLHAAGIERARAVAITVDTAATAARIARAIREHFPELTIIARAHDLSNAEVLEQAGVDMAVPETLEASLQLGVAVLTECGRPPETLYGVVAKLREDHYATISSPIKGEGREHHSLMQQSNPPPIG